VWALEIVEVLPLLELEVEQLGVVNHHPGQHPVELLVVDAVGSLDLAIEPRSRWPDVDVANASIEQVPVKRRLELRTVVGLDLFDPEGQLLEDVVNELDGGLLVQLSVGLEDAEPGAVIDGGELVVLPAW